MNDTSQHDTSPHESRIDDHERHEPRYPSSRRGIERPARDPGDQLQDKAGGSREAQLREAGLVELRAPPASMRVILDAITCAKLVAAKGGEIIGDGEALARIAEHFVRVPRRRVQRE